MEVVHCRLGAGNLSQGVPINYLRLHAQCMARSLSGKHLQCGIATEQGGGVSSSVMDCTALTHFEKACWKEDSSYCAHEFHWTCLVCFGAGGHFSWKSEGKALHHKLAELTNRRSHAHIYSWRVHRRNKKLNRIKVKDIRSVQSGLDPEIFEDKIIKRSINIIYEWVKALSALARCLSPGAVTLRWVGTVGGWGG